MISTREYQQTEAPPAHYHFDSVAIIVLVNGQERRHTGGGLTFDRRGVTMNRPGHHPATIIPWTKVRSLASGPPAMFDDGTAATTIDVTTDDQFIRFLVPVDQLASWQVGVLQLFGKSAVLPGVGTALQGIAPFKSP